MRSRSFLLLALVAWTAASAQTPPALVQSEEQADPRQNQKIQRIRVEDDGARIDELRVGGQTQSITVQPKSGAPEYEFQPTDLARSRPADNRDGLSSPSSQRVWNIFKF
jgi:hypothetical protein